MIRNARRFSNSDSIYIEFFSNLHALTHDANENSNEKLHHTFQRTDHTQINTIERNRTKIGNAHTQNAVDTADRFI